MSAHALDAFAAPAEAVNIRAAQMEWLMLNMPRTYDVLRSTGKAMRVLLAIAGGWFLIAAVVSAAGGPCLAGASSVACSIKLQHK